MHRGRGQHGVFTTTHQKRALMSQNAAGCTGLTPRGTVLQNVNSRSRQAANQRHETSPGAEPRGTPSNFDKWVVAPTEGRAFLYPSTSAQAAERSRVGKSYDAAPGKGRYREKNKNIIIIAGNNKLAQGTPARGVRLPRATKAASLAPSHLRARKRSQDPHRKGKSPVPMAPGSSLQLDSASEVRLGSKLTDKDEEGRMVLYESKEALLLHSSRDREQDTGMDGDADTSQSREQIGTQMSGRVSPRSPTEGHAQPTDAVYRYNSDYNKSKQAAFAKATRAPYLQKLPDIKRRAPSRTRNKQTEAEAQVAAGRAAKQYRASPFASHPQASGRPAIPPLPISTSVGQHISAEDDDAPF